MPQTRSKTRAEKQYQKRIYLNGRYSVQELCIILSTHMAKCCPQPKRHSAVEKHFERLSEVEKNVAQ